MIVFCQQCNTTPIEVWTDSVTKRFDSQLMKRPECQPCRGYIWTGAEWVERDPRLVKIEQALAEMF